jgi:chemotaxis protein MotB
MRDSHRDAPAPEIVIVRRRHDGEDEGHHGGVWKIAFADFMTALMTFFLVMWLVSAASKKTVSQIAAYFNPVKLSDKAPMSKGVRNLTSLPEGEIPRWDGECPQISEVLQRPEKKAGSGEPFGLKEATAAQGDKTAPGPSTKAAAAATEAIPPALDNPLHMVVSEGSGGEQPKPEAPGKALGTVPTAEPEKPAKDPPAPEQAKTTDDSIAADKKKVEADLKKALEVLLADKHPAIEVKLERDGILISLTDTLDFEMFKLASPEPVPQLQPIMEQIASVLGRQDGRIVVRGHTDGRPFRTARYDNWKLSSDRAYAAYDLLVKSGIGDTRFLRIEGYADRSLKNAAAPLAAQNRRIDILLLRSAS